MMAKSNDQPNTNNEVSKIQTFYKGSKIFVTGGSGFLGNLLIEKLIRDCPDLSKIYMLMRSKKDKTPEKRLEELLQDPVFERMKSEQPKYLEKLQIVVGDIEQPDLGLSESDMKFLSEEIDVVFHIAATVRFNEKLRRGTICNVIATQFMIKLAKTMTKLKSFIYVSTAYSHCARKDIGEQFYDVPNSPEKIFEITKVLNDEELEILTPKLIDKWPNVYAYSKALAEKIIEDHVAEIPIGIVRPSMVISTYKEPMESWINNFYGPVGVTLGVGLGLVRATQADPNVVSDMVPADYTANCVIAAAYHVGTHFIKKPKIHLENNNIDFDEMKDVKPLPVFNYVSSVENPLTWGKYVEYSRYFSDNWQTSFTIWYNFVILYNNIYVIKFLQFFLQKVPAYLVDFIFVISGKKPRLVAAYSKIDNFQTMIAFFSTQAWIWTNDNTQALWESLNDTDRRLFPFSMKELNWFNYFRTFAKGIRVYLLKDPLETLPAGLKKYQRLKIAHYTVVTILCSIFIICLFKMLQMLY